MLAVQMEYQQRIEDGAFNGYSEGNCDICCPVKTWWHFVVYYK